MAVYLSWSEEILVTSFLESLEWSDSKKLAGYIFLCCVALALSLPLLAGFVVQSLLAVLLCHLGSTEEGNSWKQGCAWQQLRSLYKYLGRRGWGDYWCFMTLSSCCSYRATVLLWARAQSNNTRRKAAWLPGLKYLLACRLALICRFLGLSPSNNKNNIKNYNNKNTNINI